MANVVVKGIDQTTGRARPIAAADVATKTDLSSIVGEKLGIANGIATLDGSSLVVQNPASATAAVTPNAIVRRGADSSILVNILEAPGANSITLRNNSLDRWVVTSAGHLTAFVDNTYDIGAAGATRPRTIHVGSSILIDSSPSQLSLDGLSGDGQNRDTLISSVGGNLNMTAPAGEWIWIGATELAVQEVYVGAYNGASYTAIQGGSAGIELLTDNDGPINMAVSNAEIQISLGGTIPFGGGFLVNCNGSVKLFAANGMELLATGGSNVITAATTLGIGAGTAINIGTTGSPAINIGGAGATVNISDVGNVNGKAGTSLFITPNLGLVLELRGGQPATATSTGGALNVTSGPGGATSGNSGDVNLRSGAVISGTPGNLNLGVNNTNYWRVNASGHFIAVTDNTHDLGATGATRPRTIYVGTSALFGTTNPLTISETAVSRAGAGIALGDAGQTVTFPGSVNVQEILSANALPVPVVLSATTVDLDTVATTNLYTVPVGKTAVILDAIVKPTTATAAVGDAEMGIGVAAGEDDMFASVALTGLNDTTERYVFTRPAVAKVAAAGEIIKAGVDVADTGTALVATVYLIGYLI